MADINEADADAAADAFRPAWDAGGDESDVPPPAAEAKPSITTNPGVAPPANSPAAPPTSPNGFSVNKSTMIGGITPAAAAVVAAANAANAAAAAAAAKAAQVQAAIPQPEQTERTGKPAMDSATLIDAVPPVAVQEIAKTVAARPPAPKPKPPVHAPVEARPASVPPAAKKDVVADPFRSVAHAPPASDFDDEIIIPKRKSKGLVYGAAGLIIAVGIGAGIKLGSKTDVPPATPAMQFQPPAQATTADIPPPPPKDEITPPPAATTAAAVTTQAAPKAPEPPPPLPAPTHAKPDPAPPRTVAAAQPRNNPPAVKPPSPAPSPKNPPKSNGGGIVRDSPF